MTPLQLLQIKIGVKPDGSFGPTTIKAIKNYFKLTNERTAHFCGQCAHETGGYQLFVENLNYSATGLRAIFGKYFSNNLEESYARQPVKIGSRVYANRMGNGNEDSQEGFKFRGRGALQLTGKLNYKALSEYLNKPEIMDNPDLVGNDYAFESAMFFFEKNKLWGICDKGVDNDTILALTKRINGGTHGLPDRISLTNRYYNWLTK
jgi:putative chitinase